MNALASLVAFALIVAAPARPATPQPAASVDADLRARVHALVDLLSQPDRRSEARAAIVALGREATPYLLERMRDPVFTIRWEMANVQGDIRDERARPALVDNVVRDSDPHVRWRSIWALNEMPESGDAETTRLLLEELRGADEGDRWNAAVGLSMFGSAAGLDLIHAGLRSEDSWRRWEAINALGRVHDERTPALLAEVLKTGTVKERSEAVLSLGRTERPQALEPLIAALADPAADVRWRAAMSLVGRSDPKLRPALERLQADEDAEVRRQAKRALDALVTAR